MAHACLRRHVASFPLHLSGFFTESEVATALAFWAFRIRTSGCRDGRDTAARR